MSDCRKLEPLLTPYVDGEAPPRERAEVDAHLHACRPCGARVEAEGAVRALLQQRRSRLLTDAAPADLRARCRAVATRQPRDGRSMPGQLSSTLTRPVPAAGWRTRAVPLALAASLTLMVAGAFLYQATTRSSRVLAAELAADHVKCFATNRVLAITSEPAAAARTYLASSFGWDAQLPELPGLNLETARPCLYGEGRIAHVMYRYGGRPVSLFMLPRTTRREELVETMGHEAAIWSVDGRTFVLVARESRDDLQRLAAVMRGTVR